MTKTGTQDQLEVVQSVDLSAVQDFRALFDAHAGYVWNSLRRLGVAEDDIEDLLHDVFLHVHRSLQEYDRSRPIRPWLFGFAFRLASQHRRLARHRREVRGDAEAVDMSPTADEALTQQEDRMLVSEALSEIDLERRAVFVMFEVDEVPMDEIARVLDVPVNTGYSRLRRAREEFAAAVKRLRARRGGS
jgi:RNA polymerase sigma-70 factor, ECF subfamily